MYLNILYYVWDLWCAILEARPTSAVYLQNAPSTPADKYWRWYRLSKNKTNTNLQIKFIPTLANCLGGSNCIVCSVAFHILAYRALINHSDGITCNMVKYILRDCLLCCWHACVCCCMLILLCLAYHCKCILMILYTVCGCTCLINYRC